VGRLRGPEGLTVASSSGIEGCLVGTDRRLTWHLHCRYENTERRKAKVEGKGLRYMGMGVSGGRRAHAGVASHDQQQQQQQQQLTGQQGSLGSAGSNRSAPPTAPLDDAPPRCRNTSVLLSAVCFERVATVHHIFVC